MFVCLTKLLISFLCDQTIRLFDQISVFYLIIRLFDQRSNSFTRLLVNQTRFTACLTKLFVCSTELLFVGLNYSALPIFKKFVYLLQRLLVSQELIFQQLGPSKLGLIGQKQLQMDEIPHSPTRPKFRYFLVNCILYLYFNLNY